MSRQPGAYSTMLTAVQYTFGGANVWMRRKPLAPQRSGQLYEKGKIDTVVFIFLDRLCIQRRLDIV